jgi:Raf kinase inhibitor-like YbhB/YbcL family protein
VAPDASAGTGGAAADATVQPDVVAGGPFALTSTAFAANGVIIKKYRCQGEGEGGNVSPPLGWTPGPAGTKSYAVTMRSGGSPHWALWDVSADTLSLPEKIERAPMPPIPAGSKQCKPNVDGSTWFGYAGACPRGGTNLRPYYFVVWALKVDTLPNVTPESSIAQVNAAIMANQIGMAQLIGQAAPNSP